MKQNKQSDRKMETGNHFKNGHKKMNLLMKHFIYVNCILCFIFTSSRLSADPINPNTAVMAAKSFFDSKLTLRSASNEEPVIVRTDKRSDTENYFYVLESPNKHGWVILAGNDDVTPVIAYSDEGSFNQSNSTNANFEYWMDCMKEEINYITSNNKTTLRSSIQSKAKTEWDNLLTQKSTQLRAANASQVADIPRLLGNIIWAQSNVLAKEGEPPTYNKFTPYNWPVGCVAVAVGQIMKAQLGTRSLTGTGSHSDTYLGYENLSADFANTTYNFANMPNQIWGITFTKGYFPTDVGNIYPQQSTDTEINAVAQLLYHIGIACNMNYTSSGSGTTDLYVGAALTDYFKYQTPKYIARTDVSDAIWASDILTELQAGRPVYYSGQNPNTDSNGKIIGGHSFVVDGYSSSEQKYHFNWGWGGYQNGNFALSLTEGDGTDPTLAYKNSQQMIIGLSPMPDAPTVTTLAATNITQTTATLNNSIKAGMETIKAQGFQYRISGATSWNTTTNGNLTGLTASTTYQFRAYATTASNTTYYGNILTFTTLAPPTYTISASVLNSFGSLQTPYTQPAAQTVTITNTGTGAVTLTQPTANNYEIGTLSTTTLSTNGAKATFTVRPKANLPVGAYNETISISGTNNASATVSVTFTVIPPDIKAPTVITLDATNITQTSATLNKTVIAGTETIIEQGFEWMVFNPQAQLSWNTLTNGNFTGLNPNTTYQFRAYAKTASGTTYGDILKFTTLANVPNDLCANAANLPCGTTLSGTLAGATPTTSVKYPVDPSPNDIFYKFTASNSGTYIITLTKNNSSDDIDLGLYSNCSSTDILVQLWTNDMTGTMKYDCIAGATYYVRVIDIKGTGGTFSIKVDCPVPCTTPPNYDVDLSTPIVSGTWLIDQFQGNCDIKVFRIPVTFGIKYRFSVSTAIPRVLDLYNTSGTLIVHMDNGTSANQDETIEWQATYTGYVYAQVSGDNASRFNFFYAQMPAITATAGTGGTISPAGTVYVSNGGDQTFTITPNSCYSIDQVLVDNVNNPAAVSSGSYTFNNVTANHTISVSFKLTNSWKIGSPNPDNVIATFNNGTLTITGTGAMQDWIYNNTTMPWACVREQIKNIVINEGVTSIGNYAFMECTALTVTLPKSITQIGAYAFLGCNSLTDVTVNWQTPLSISNIFDRVNNVSNINLHVPAGMQCAYAATPVWQNFNIIGAQLTITASAGSNGSISPSGATTVNCGGSQTYTFTPNSGYSIDQVLVDNVNNSSAVSSGSYTFSNVTANHTISVSFKAKTYTLTFDAQGGTVSPSNQPVTYGTTVGTLPTPTRNDYIFGGWFTQTNGSGTQYFATTIYSTADNTMLYAFWSAIPITTYTITASVVGSNGTISPSGNISVNQGSSQTFNFYPNNGYEINQVMVDNVTNSSAVSAGNYTFSNVTAKHTISVSFKAISSAPCTTPPNYDADLSTPTVTGTWLTDQFQGNCDIKVYRISVTAGKKYKFSVSTAIDRILDLYNSSGAQIIHSDNGTLTNQDETIEWQATYTGYVFAKVSGANASRFNFFYAEISNNVSINDVAVNQLKIYPNPVKADIFIKSDLPIKKVEIYLLTGDLMITENNFNEKISVATLPKGVYLLKVYTDKSMKVSKIVKK